jgi:hypothetical protein
MPKRTKPKLWEKIVKQIKTENIAGTKKGQWSARKAQLAVVRYKKKGGSYIGRKDKSNSLVKWTKQKWRTKSGKKSSKTGERYLPSKSIKRLSDENYKRTSAKKKKDTKKGKQFSKQPKDIVKKLKKLRFGERYARTNKPEGSRKRTKTVKGVKVTYQPSTRKDKKWMITTPKGKKVHWGHPTMKDYTQHRSLKRRSNYRKRHAGILLKDGSRAIDKKWSPAWLSYYVTW